MCLHAGTVMRSHGVNGAVVAKAQKGFNVDTISFEYLFVELDGGLVPYYVDDIRELNDEEAIISFEDVGNQESAKALTGAAIYIYRDWLDDEEGYETMSGALVGYTASDVELGTLGDITSIMDIANNPLFVVDYNGEVLLIPITDDFIVSVDDDAKTVVFQLPEGLVDIHTAEDGDSDE